MASLTITRRPSARDADAGCPWVLVLSRAETVIGRTPPRGGNHLQLPDSCLNHRHARVTHADGAYWVEDLRSCNHTLLNAAEVTQRTRLADGDRIRVCDWVLHFCGGDPAGPAPAGWLTDTVLSLAGYMHVSCDLSAMPILADALEDAGCGDEQVLGHCRRHDPRAPGCWALNLLLGGSGPRALPNNT